MRIERHPDQLEELDGEGVLALAERVLPRTADLWFRRPRNTPAVPTSPFLPEGATFDGKPSIRTGVTGPTLSYLWGARPKVKVCSDKQESNRSCDRSGNCTASVNEDSSDVDLLVEFDDMAHAERADAHLGFLTAVEALLRRRVDLVELGAVRNPYVRRGIEESRELVYAA
jgi:uncharacterized protein